MATAPFTKDEINLIASAIEAAITVASRNQKGKAPMLVAAFQKHETTLRELLDKVRS